ncbi:MAG: Ig-like domain-containing protein [Clostridium sp.]|nr:Ig-like domain-containing protein [Clostridium sp.]
MKLSSFLKRLGFTGLLFLVFTLTPNPLSSRFVETVEASEVDTDEEASKIKLNVKSKSLILDEAYTIKVYRTSKNQKISFKSSDSDIVAVKKSEDKEAEITACGIGDTTITVTVKEGSKTIASLKCDVSVTPPAVSVKLIDGKISLKPDDKVSLKKELKPSTTSETPTFITTNSNVVTVSSRGVVTAVSEGKAYIYAFIANGTYDRCLIEVTPEPTVE